MTKRHTIVGLDIGRHCLKAAWVVLRRRKPVVVRTELLHIPFNERDPGRIIRPWLTGTGIASLPCAIGISGQDCVFQSFLMQREDPRSPAQASEMEVAKFNEIAATEMAYGFTLYQNADDERRLLVAIVKPAKIDAQLEFTATLGLNVVDLIPAPIALFNAAEAATEGIATPQMHINIGHTHTEVAFGSGRGLLFARSFGSGGETFSEALRSGNGMSIAQADTFKITRGALDGDDREVAIKLSTVADFWLAEVQACLSSYRNQMRSDDLEPGQIILSGGGSLLRGLRQRLEATTGLRVVHADASLVNLLPTRPEHFVVAAGLALTAHGVGKASVSLLPEYVRHELVFREKKPFWIASGVAVALTVGVIIVGGVRAMGRQSVLLKEAEQTVTELRELTSRIENSEAASAVLRSQCEPLMALLAMGPRYRDLVTLVAESLAPHDWISMICDEYAYYETAPDEKERQAKRGGAPGMRDSRLTRGQEKEDSVAQMPLPTRFIVEGYTPKANLATVRDLIERLRGSSLVKTADLIYDDQKVPAERFRPELADAAHNHFVILLEVALR